MKSDAGVDGQDEYSVTCVPFRESDCVFLRIVSRGLPTLVDVSLFWSGKQIHKESRQFSSNQLQEFLVIDRKFTQHDNRCSGSLGRRSS